MKRNHVARLALAAAAALLLSACAGIDASFLTQGRGHFNAKSFSFDLGGSGSSLVAQGHGGGEAPGILAPIVNGVATGLGSEDYTLGLVAEGEPLVICRNNGNHDAPGQNPAVSAGGFDSLDGDDPTRDKGRVAFAVAGDVSSIDPNLDPLAAGCPNSNWDATIDFIFWDLLDVTLTNSEGQITDRATFLCETTFTSISCSRQK